MPGVDPARSQRMREIGLAGARAKKVAAVERRIRELIDTAPPLSESQRSRLAMLLRPSSCPDVAASTLTVAEAPAAGGAP